MGRRMPLRTVLRLGSIWWFETKLAETRFHAFCLALLAWKTDERTCRAMDYEEITNNYYAKWLGVTPADFDKNGVRFVYSPQRDTVQKGYSQPFDIFAWIADKNIIVSYGSKTADKIPLLKNLLSPAMSAEDISLILQTHLGGAPRKYIKFGFAKLPEVGVKSYKMTAADFPLYEAFFAACNPNCRDTSWLHEYYTDMTTRGLCYGEIISGKLVSMNDLPDMPYMESKVQELGINTLPEYQGQGLARRVCATCIHDMIHRGVCPQWSTGSHNEASRRLALSVGFFKIANVLTITL